MQQLKQRVLATVAIVLIVMGTVGAIIFVGHNGTGGRNVTRHLPTAGAINRAPTDPSTTTPTPLPAGNDWTQYRFDVYGTGVNSEGRISATNVTQLSKRWTYSSFSPFESTPAIVNGVIYVPNNNSLYAFDLSTGKKLWSFQGIPQKFAAISSSVAVDPKSHLAYYGTPDARVYAINTLTGTEIWNTQLGDPNTGAFIWSSPLLVNGKVYIGLASHNDNPCVRGGVFALDPASGKVVWRHYMVPSGSLGGTVWSSLIANPGRHELIATTGNPCPNGTVYAQTDAFVAMDWDTGATHWQYTALASDYCDCDFGEGAVDYIYHGHEYIVAGNKYGMVYALTPPTANQDVRLAWSIRITGFGYLGQGGIFEPPTYSNGIVFVAGGPTLDGTCHSGALYAFQADTGATRWRVCTAGQVVSPASTTGDVLFVAQQDILVAYDPTTGHVLWQAAQSGAAWGGVSISRGSVVVGTVSGKLYCYSLPTSSP